jgi:hypothetical protein
MSGPTTNGCAALRTRVQLGLHLVVDESASMVFPNDLWSPLGNALGRFFASDQAARMQLGIEFFQGACDPAAYATPSLPIAPAAGQQPALGAAMQARTHGPGAATALALSGALDQARQWSMSNQGYAAVMLISGSEPTACLGSTTTAAGVASSALTTMPAVPTYVVALRGLPSLDRIAQAGGTGQARVVSDPTAEQALLETMQVAASQAGCQYGLPAAATSYLPDRINLELTQGGTTTIVPHVASAQDCDPALGGWYFDDPQSPKRVVACDASCKRVAQGGDLDLVFGCASVSKP